MSPSDTALLLAQLRHAIAELEGVTAHPHRGPDGGWTFQLDDRELGHVHATGVTHVLLPKRERKHVVQAGLAAPLRTAPASGWVEFIPMCADDALAAAALFRRAHRARAASAVAA